MRDELELLAIRSGLPVDEVARREQRRTWTGAFVTREPDSSIQERAASADESARPEPGQELRLYGYSAVFDRDSELLYGFVREQVKRGAFKSVLKRDDLDVRLLINHEGAAHARTTNGTLKLREDARGLYRDALLDARRHDSRDLYYSVERGDMSQSSVAFTIKRSEWRFCDCVQDPNYAGCGCEWERDIIEIGELLDDSVVTYPAYPDANATVARESEPSGERNAPASDEERRDTAPEADTSLTQSVGDPTNRARRSRLARIKGSTSVAGYCGGARSRA